MRLKILKLIPEIELINDIELREKVIVTLIDAVESGGWKIDEISDLPFTLLVDCPGVDFITHTRTVTNISIKTAEILMQFQNQKIDMDILIAGAILHDVGKFLEIERVNKKYMKSANGKFLRHPFSGLALAYKNNLPTSVCHIIAVHSREGNEGWRSPEAVIIHHSDFAAFDTLRT